MTKSYLEGMVNADHTIREIAGIYGCSPTNIRYWLNKHGLKTNHLERRHPPRPANRTCLRCDETDPSAFYGSRWTICKACDDARTKIRAEGNRWFALSLLGHICTVPECGVSASCALDIHHTDATVKDPAFRTMRHWSRARIRAELATCILLCKNHHALEHARLRAVG